MRTSSRKACSTLTTIGDVDAIAHPFAKKPAVIQNRGAACDDVAPSSVVVLQAVFDFVKFATADRGGPGGFGVFAVFGVNRIEPAVAAEFFERLIR